MSFLALVILAAAAAPDATVANPLAPALAGQVECTQPDAQKKTCRSITSYQRDGAGYRNDALILISANGPVTVEISAPVTVKGDAVCGVPRVADLDAARVRNAGRLLDATEAAPAHAAMLHGLAPVIDKEICQTYQTTPAGLVQKSSVDGVYEPRADVPVAWVSPGDGYKVAP